MENTIYEPVKFMENAICEPFSVIKDDIERAVRFNRIEDDTKDMAGKILTIVDASIADAKQNKAIKDLIKKEIRNYLGRYEDICFFGKKQGHIPLDNF